MNVTILNQKTGKTNMLYKNNKKYTNKSGKTINKTDYNTVYLLNNNYYYKKLKYDEKTEKNKFVLKKIKDINLIVDINNKKSSTKDCGYKNDIKLELNPKTNRCILPCPIDKERYIENFNKLLTKL